MRHRLPPLVAILLSLAAPHPGRAAEDRPAPLPPPDARGFRPLTVDEALAHASREKLPVLLRLHARWSLPCARMGQVSFRDLRVSSLLRRAFVSIEVDVAEQPELAERFEISRVPAILILDAQGRERDFILGFRAPQALSDELRAHLAGQNAVARAQARLEKAGANDPFAREMLAVALARRGRYDDALEHFLFCLDRGLRNVMYAAARRDFLTLSLAELAADYAPARTRLHSRRDALEARVREFGHANDARNLVALHRALEETDRTLKLYDQLPDDKPARAILLDAILEQLVQQRRYADVLRQIDPLPDFKSRRGGGMACCSVHTPRGPGSRAYVLDRGAALIEALAAQARDDEARHLIAEVLAFENTQQARETIKARLERVRRTDLLPYEIRQRNKPAEKPADT